MWTWWRLEEVEKEVARLEEERVTRLERQRRAMAWLGKIEKERMVRLKEMDLWDRRVNE